MEPYLHKVQYYETDKMGIAIIPITSAGWKKPAWDFLEKIGMGF